MDSAIVSRSKVLGVPRYKARLCNYMLSHPQYYVVWPWCLHEGGGSVWAQDYSGSPTCVLPWKPGMYRVTSIIWPITTLVPRILAFCISPPQEPGYEASPCPDLEWMVSKDVQVSHHLSRMRRRSKCSARVTLISPALNTLLHYDIHWKPFNDDLDQKRRAGKDRPSRLEWATQVLVEGGCHRRLPLRARARSKEALSISSKPSTWTLTEIMKLSSNWLEKVTTPWVISLAGTFSLLSNMVLRSRLRYIACLLFHCSFVGIRRAQEKVCTGIWTGKLLRFSISNLHN